MDPRLKCKTYNHKTLGKKQNEKQKQTKKTGLREITQVL